ncbi:uncharacterized protein LOC126892364 [Diabrotica virgifera virgifera]|uniref:Uncharacterized protein n=2 Tax=Diabrotica virgifera virgifera TaxID=50390 RepID=A0ABM5L5X4_DIAVI|nr:uncharacterized protein LOC126892364 [Diabrotica virgifera virgifera]
MSYQSKCGCPLTPTFTSTAIIHFKTSKHATMNYNAKIEQTQDFPTRDTLKTFSDTPGLRKRNVASSSNSTVNDQTAGTTQLSRFSQTNLSRSPGFSIKSPSNKSQSSAKIKIISGNIASSRSSTNINHPPNNSTAVNETSKLSSTARSTPDLRSISSSSKKIISPNIQSGVKDQPAIKLKPTSNIERERSPSNKMSIPRIRLNFEVDAEYTRF